MIVQYLLLIYLISLAKGNDLSTANNAFAAKLYKKLEEPSEDLVFSPFAIFSTLVLIREGATGRTETLLRKVLDLPNKKETAKQYRYILLAGQEHKLTVIETVNKLYSKKDYIWKDQFQRLARDYYQFDIGSESFEDIDDAVRSINSWVKDETNSLVREIVTPRNINSSIEILALNAIHLKGLWALGFEKTKIESLPFFKTHKSKIYTDFVSNTGEYEYYESEELDAQCLKLNYKDERFSMTIILPNERMGISTLNRLVGNVDIGRLNDKMYRRQVRVTIPIFKFEDSYDMEEVLRALGLGDIFDRSDLTEMIENQDKLSVTKFIQKIEVEVNENGTEAGSSVIDSLETRIASLVFTADHPFIFTVNLEIPPDGDSMEKEYTILFMGKVRSPSSD